MLGVLLAGVAAALVGLSLDAAGRILLSALALLLLSEGLWLLLARPVVSVGDWGVRAREGLRMVEASWADVASVQARPARRVIAVDTLELELGDRLIVVPAYRLGTSAVEAAAAIEAARPVSP